MRIQNKLFVAFLLAGISLVALMFILMQWSLTKGLLEFVNTKERDNLAPLVEVLKQRYSANGNWHWLDKRHRLFHDLFRDSMTDGQQMFTPPRPGQHRPPRHHRPQDRPQDRPPPRRGEARQDQDHFAHRPPPRRGRANDSPGFRPPRGPNARPIDLSLFNQDKRFLVGKPDANERDQWLAIEVDNKTVGWLVIPRRDGITQGYELTLLEQQRNAFFLISLLLSALTIVIAMPLARNLVEPIKRLAGSMDQLTQGNYKSRITLKRNDELGRLGRNVNELAMTLEENETARKRWLANISHELRTPIAVLKSEMEAVIDGVRPLNTDHVGSSYQEVQRLQRLVEDLYELSASDIGGMKYRKEEFDLVEFIEDELDAFEHILESSAIGLSHALGDKPIIIWADAVRLCQLFHNILVNCAKYGDTNGQVHLSLQRHKKQVKVMIEDNGKGVEQQHLAHLFEHLYRVDDSRNRNTGGSGLGLAICKQIVEAHQGNISAQRSTLGGLAVVIELPIAKR